jgi:pimeloyl-ACP methyl ester carboxylesterase
VLPELPSRYHVFVPDQRGHGGSERPKAGYAPEDFAADVLAFMDAVGVERAALVGHSMGSFVAQAVAAAAPDRITRLVLVGSAADPRTPALVAFQQEVEALADPVPPEFAREFQLSTLHQPVPPAFLHDAVAASRQVPARVWRAALAGILSDPGVRRLDRIRMPTLLLYGEHDAIWSRAQQDSLRALLPQATLRVYGGVGHAPHWERPAEFARDLDAFLSGS